MDYKIISGDGHIDLRWLPHDVFVSRSPAKWKDLVPQVVDTAEGKKWYVEGKDVAGRPFGGLGNLQNPERGRSAHVDRMYEMGFYDGESHPTTPDLRLRDMDIDGVDADVIYGILAMGSIVEDKELLRVIYGMYNDWASEFCNTNPDRLAALACIPNDDPDAAAAELRRAAKLGLRGADFNVGTAIYPIWHKDWEPLWAAAGETGIPVSFHTTGYPFRRSDDPKVDEEHRPQIRATLLSLFQIAGAEFLTGVIFSGALERHPNMKFVLGECGASWIPYVLSRMDEEYEDTLHTDLGFSLKPSEFWRRQGYTTFQHESHISQFINLVGEDNIIWGSDYPHPDGIWPDSLKWIEEDLAGVDENVKQKIICDNAAKLYFGK